MVLFVMLYKVFLTFDSADEILSVTIRMKATDWYFPMVMFIMLYKVVLNFDPVDEICKCNHSNDNNDQLFNYYQLTSLMTS